MTCSIVYIPLLYGSDLAQPCMARGGREPARLRAVRAVMLSLFVVMSGLAVAMVSGNVAATTVDYYGLNGYQGNSAIYMTTGVNAQPYVFPTLNNSAHDTSNMYSIENTINVSAGKSPRPTTSTLVFNEQYNPSSAELVVTIPIVAGGASETNVYTPPYPPGSPTHFETVAYQTISIDVSFASPNTHTDILASWNSGINVTGPNYQGTTKDEALVNLGIDSLSFSKQFGFAIGVYQVMKDLESLSGVDEHNPGVVGNGTAFETFEVNRGSETQNVFVSQLRLQVTIPHADFTSYVPRLDVSALNRVTNTYQFPHVIVDGARAQLTQITSAPAVTLTGTVYAAGGPLANKDFVLSTYIEGPLVNINYHLKTDQNGRYRFFAGLNAPYTIQADYVTSFGSISGQNSTTTLNSPDSQTLDLVLPVSKIHGNVRSSGGNGIGGASVAVTNPSGTTFATTTDSSGYYFATTNSLGAYGVTATACGYGSQTQSVGVSASNTVYRADFTYASGTGSIGPIHVGFGDASPGALVTIRNCQGTTVYSARADSSGNVPGTTGLAYDVYTVEASAKDWSNCPLEGWLLVGSVTVALPPDQSPTVPLQHVYRTPCPT